MVDIYDSSRGLVKLGPCLWSPNMDIAFWLSQDNDTILKVKFLVWEVFTLKTMSRLFIKALCDINRLTPDLFLSV